MRRPRMRENSVICLVSFGAVLVFANVVWIARGTSDERLALIWAVGRLDEIRATSNDYKVINSTCRRLV